MRVSELVTEPSLRIALGVRGDVDRDIEWVHAIDRYPASEFLSEGEVALTSGQWWPAVNADDFVADLVSAGVVALGFGITSTVSDLPSQLLEACERLELTYFLVPREVSFSQVIRTFVRVERRRWERPLRRQLDFHDSFVTGLREDRSITGMLRAIAAASGLDVALLSDRQLVGAESVEEMHSLPLEPEGIADGVLYLDRPVELLSDEQRAVLAVATPFVALEIERLRSVRRTVDTYTRELFTWLRAGDQDQVSIEARLGSLGIQSHERMTVIALGAADLDAVLAAVRRRLGTAAVAARLDDRVLVCLGDTDDEGVSHLISAMPRGTSAGVGSIGGPERLRLSFIQAEHALQLAGRMGPGSVVGAADLASPSSILRSEPSDLMREAATALLEPLREYDEARGGQLLRTLRVFLSSGGRWNVAATELYIHPNTLRHRIQIIEDITGRSLDRTRDRTDFDIALSLDPTADEGAG